MADADLIMASPAEVAARDGVTKQAVTKLVRQLVEKHGLPVERDGRDRITRFSLAHYDHLRGAFASSVKVTAARQAEEPAKDLADGQTSVATSNSRDEALRQEAWLKVGRGRLAAQEEAGQLVRADRLKDGLAVSGQAIRAIIARLPNKADDMALAVSREGVHGLRVLLRQVAFDLNSQIADELEKIGWAAPEKDEAPSLSESDA